jgi:hypothetical protein
MWSTGNIFEDKLRTRVGTSQMVLGPGKILKFRPVQTSGTAMNYYSILTSAD